MSDLSFGFFLTQSYDKAPAITLKEGKTSLFRWKVEQFSLYADTVIASRVVSPLKDAGGGASGRIPFSISNCRGQQIQ